MFTYRSKYLGIQVTWWLSIHSKLLLLLHVAYNIECMTIAGLPREVIPGSLANTRPARPTEYISALMEVIRRPCHLKMTRCALTLHCRFNSFSPCPSGRTLTPHTRDFKCSLLRSVPEYQREAASSSCSCSSAWQPGSQFNSQPDSLTASLTAQSAVQYTALQAADTWAPGYGLRLRSKVPTPQSHWSTSHMCLTVWRAPPTMSTCILW